MSRRSRICGALLPAGLLLAAGVAAPAAAYVTPGATVVSASLERREQADDSTNQVAISGDGRYVAFTTRARNFFADDDADPEGRFRNGGIFRRDLATGALELVAHGELRTEDDQQAVLIRGAVNPSLSHDGRFVAFSTAYPLVPDDVNGHVDVYVRDMALPAGAAGAYDLVSRTSAGTPARYAPLPEGQDRPGVNLGTEITPRQAISADGRHVVFRSSDVRTDLPAGGELVTPGNQLFVRDRAAGTTTLVSRDRLTGEPAGGAIGGASISADGTTVAWAGREAPRQTVMLPGEGADPVLDYYLWRRVADGDAAVTRRITGFGDPADPACPGTLTITENPLAGGPCYGPLGSPEARAGSLINTPPALSADGTRVAYLTASGPRGVLVQGTAADAWVTDMRPGVARRDATVELTRDGGTTAATSAPIDALSLSADGRWLALTTLRTQQLLTTLRSVGAVRGAATERDLYLVDLQGRTIERAATGGDGGDPDGGVIGQPSIDATGTRIAFVSAASNLFYGDANNRPDAFVSERAEPPAPDAVVAPGGETADAVLPLVVVGDEEPEPTRITVRASRGSKGRVRLRIKLPEPATGAVRANGRLRNAEGKRIGRTRQLGRATVRAKKAGTLTVRLPIAKSLRGRLRAARKLTASARVEVTGKSGTEYLGRVTVEFRP